jgi:hypothetical protein
MDPSDKPDEEDSSKKPSETEEGSYRQENTVKTVSEMDETNK